MAAIAKSAIKFFQPFMLELEHIFRFGFEVESYNYPTWRISRHIQSPHAATTIRAILMLVTGDHPAQCKMGKLKQSGVAAYR